VNEERILVVVPEVVLDGGTRAAGDLVFTSRQVFLVRAAVNSEAAHVSRVVGAAAAAQRSMNASQQLRAQSLEAILASADPHTRFEYRELQSIGVRLGGLFSSPAVSLVPRHGGSLKFRGRRAALEHLASAVPFLVGAGAPISVS
jgi:hypothetical protein